MAYYSKDAQSTEIILEENNKSCQSRVIVGVALLLGLSFVVGLLVGRYAICTDRDGASKDPVINEAIVREADPNVGDEIIRQIDRNKIRQYLR